MKAIKSYCRSAVRWVSRRIPSLKNRAVPKSLTSLAELANLGVLVEWREVHAARTHHPHKPVTLENELHPIFCEHLSWSQPAACVATIPRGRVWGRRGAVITGENELVADVSREFGVYKGISDYRHPIFEQAILPPVQRGPNAAAVIASPGASNFHHWMFDTLPRLSLLQASDMYSSEMPLIVDYTGLAFQKESLNRLSIGEGNLILPESQWSFHFESQNLIVPTLCSHLGTVSDWVIHFLRNVFLGPAARSKTKRRLYVSRQNAPTRRLANAEQVEAFLADQGFEGYFAEEHPVEHTAKVFSEASVIISLHGSGLSNLVFASEGVKVLDLLPPAHVDSYYWLMTDQIGGVYAYLFAEGERPAATTDLVLHKIDKDVSVDIAKLASILKLLKV